MPGEEDQVSADLTREEAVRLLDECRDGEINEANARRLATAICAGDEDSKWILYELELSGLISQALDTTDTETFLRGFLERLSAERSATEFTEVSEERIRQTAIRAVQQKPGVRHALSLAFGHRTAEPGLSEPRRRAWGIPVAVLIAAAAMAAVLGLSSLRWDRAVGSIMTTSPGVTVDRGGSLLRAAGNLRLRAADKIQVPPDGSTVVSYRDGVWIRARAHAGVIMEPAAVPGFGETGKGSKNVYLQSGGVTVEVPEQAEGDHMTVFSPHAKIETVLGQFSVSVTPTSTRIEVKAGRVRFTRSSDRVVEDIGPGESSMASQTGSI